MARQRITEDFVKHFDLLKSRTGNSRHNLWRALDRDPQLAVTINELDRYWEAVERHRKTSPRRFIVQAHPKFHHAITEYGQGWTGILFDLWDWEAKQKGEESLSETLARELAEPVAAAKPGTSDDRPFYDEFEFFDPDWHSAADHFAGILEHLKFKADDGEFPFFSRAVEALEWFKNTVGLDFASIEERFKEFPVLVIPKHVSDKHGPDEPRSLYAYLNDVRRAYVTGADLAAIAMCRACTEILMRRHYNRDDETKLTRLVKDTQQKREFQHLRAHNLVLKIEDANSLLHSNQQDITTKERERQLIRDWVTALQDMIARAPVANPGPSSGR